MKAKFISKGNSKTAVDWAKGGKSFWNALKLGKVKAGLYNVPSVKNANKVNCYEISGVATLEPKANMIATIGNKTYMLTEVK